MMFALMLFFALLIGLMAQYTAPYNAAYEKLGIKRAAGVGMDDVADSIFLVLIVLVFRWGVRKFLKKKAPTG